MSTMKHISFAVSNGRVVVGYLHNYKFVGTTHASVYEAILHIHNDVEIAEYQKEFVSFCVIDSSPYQELIQGVRNFLSDKELVALNLGNVRIKFLTPLMVSQNRVFPVLKKETREFLLAEKEAYQSYLEDEATSVRPWSAEEQGLYDAFTAAEKVTYLCCNCGAPGGECCMDCQYDTTMYPGASRGEKGWITRSINSRRKANNWVG